jgi:hypothetical protein
MSPELILAIAAAIEMLTRNLLREIEEMTEEEKDAFIAEQKVRKMEHDAWLKSKVT